MCVKVVQEPDAIEEEKHSIEKVLEALNRIKDFYLRICQDQTKNRFEAHGKCLTNGKVIKNIFHTDTSIKTPKSRFAR